MALPKLFSKHFLGIDIGTSSIRVVELAKQGGKIELTNYGEVKTDAFQEEAFKVARRGMVFFSAEEIAQIIKTILEEAKIKTRQCAFSIPDFSTFFTNFKLPPMTRKELEEAVIFEARQHIPLPLESVTIDWSLIGGTFDTPTELEIILAAIPNEIIQQYREIARFANLEISALEAEVFGLLNALVDKKEPGVVCLVDIGTQSTTCSIIEQRVLKSSHSFDIAVNSLIEETVKKAGLDRQFAQEIKENYGFRFFDYLKPPLKDRFENLFTESFQALLREVAAITQGYCQMTGKDIKKIILSGGMSLLPNARSQFENYFKKEIMIGNPFVGISFPSLLSPELQSMGPFYSIAVGMAKRGLELK